MKKNILSLFLILSCVGITNSLEAAKKNKTNKNKTNKKKTNKKKTKRTGVGSSSSSATNTVPQNDPKLENKEPVTTNELKYEPLIKIKKEISEIINAIIEKEQLTENQKNKLQMLQKDISVNNKINIEEITKYINTQFKDTQNENLIKILEKITKFNSILDIALDIAKQKENFLKQSSDIVKKLEQISEKSKDERRFKLLNEAKDEINNTWEYFHNIENSSAPEKLIQKINELKKYILNYELDKDEKKQEKLRTELSTLFTAIKKELTLSDNKEQLKTANIDRNNFIKELNKIKTIVGDESELTKIKKEIKTEQAKAVVNKLEKIIEKKNKKELKESLQELMKNLQGQDQEAFNELKTIANNKAFVEKKNKVIEIIKKIKNKELLTKLKTLFTDISENEGSMKEYLTDSAWSLLTLGFGKTTGNERQDAIKKFLEAIAEQENIK